MTHQSLEMKHKSEQSLLILEDNFRFISLIVLKKILIILNFYCIFFYIILIVFIEKIVNLKAN